MQVKKTGMWICITAGLLLCCACFNGPTGEITPSPVPTQPLVPTMEPTPIVTIAPLPSRTPIPTKAPRETLTPTPSPSVSPTPDMDAMIGNGWQSVEDIAGIYRIIFPELFMNGFVGGDGEEISFSYKAEEEPGISFTIRYLLQKEFDEVVGVIGADSELRDAPLDSARSFLYMREEGDYIYKGRIIEHNYKGVAETSEDAFGTLVLELRYPKEQREKYETERFQYYVVRKQ